MTVLIGHKDQPIVTTLHADWSSKLTIIIAFTAPFPNECTIIMKYLYAMIAHVRYIDVAITANRTITGVMKPPITTAYTTPFPNEFSITLKYLYAMILT